MAEKELSPEIDLEPGGGPSGFKEKLNTLGSRLFSLVKLFFGVVLLVFVYSFSRAFLAELGLIDLSYQRYFWAGVITMVLFYLFVWEPAIIYNRGYRLVELIFSFFKPLVKVAPYLLPIYTIVLFLAFVVVFYMFQAVESLPYFVFFFGLTGALHLLFSAKTMRGKKNDFLKSNYVFGFALIYILNLFLLASILCIILNRFSLINFLENAYQLAAVVFKAVFRQLFL